VISNKYKFIFEYNGKKLPDCKTNKLNRDESRP